MAASAVPGLACQLLVATVLAAATVGKALDRAGTTRVLLGIGVPDRPARLASRLLPVGEGLVVAALVAVPQAGAIGAAGLFAGFTVMLAAGTPSYAGVTRPATALTVALTTAVALVVVGGQAVGVARPR